MNREVAVEMEMEMEMGTYYLSAVEPTMMPNNKLAPKPKMNNFPMSL
jgi:hypothetical protein